MRAKICLLLIFYSCIFTLNAENSIIDNPELLYQSPNEDILLSSRVTVKRTLHNIEELSNVLGGINGVSTQILDKSAQKPVPVDVYLDNATLSELLNVSAKKLGYTWKLKENKIIFSAILPILRTQGLTSHLSTKAIMPSWSLSQQDKTLRNALGKWCTRSGWHLVWNVGADYPIVVPWTINASFESAVNQVLRSTQITDIPLGATMHDNNKVLEVYSLIAQP